MQGVFDLLQTMGLHNGDDLFHDDLLVVALCVAMNVGFLKFFVEILHFYPLPSRLITSVIVVATSYYLQRIYAFKVHKSVESV